MSNRTIPDFRLEVFLGEWEFEARHHMTASDVESMTLTDLLALADRAAFEGLWLGYTRTRGGAALRTEIAATYVRMAPENILCLAGAGEGLYAVAKVLLSPEDHAIVPTPNYQSAESVPLSCCAVTGVPLRRESGAGFPWRLDVDDVRAAMRPNTKLLSLNFPHNPTGTVLAAAELQAIVELCRERGVYLLSDEVYRGIELDPSNRRPQVADVYERGISLNVLSKAYGLPGLRMGWLASQDTALLERVERYRHYLSICNPGPSEHLATVALRSRDHILARNQRLLRTNVVLLEQLFDDFPGLVQWHRPQGGCVAFPRYTGPGDTASFCRGLLEHSGVLLMPAAIYRSELAPVPQDHFRIGFGRDLGFRAGLAAMRAHFEAHPGLR